jgi:hypothetical protein
VELTTGFWSQQRSTGERKTSPIPGVIKWQLWQGKSITTMRRSVHAKKQHEWHDRYIASETRGKPIGWASIHHSLISLTWSHIASTHVASSLAEWRRSGRWCCPDGLIRAEPSAMHLAVRIRSTVRHTHGILSVPGRCGILPSRSRCCTIYAARKALNSPIESRVGRKKSRRDGDHGNDHVRSHGRDGERRSAGKRLTAKPPGGIDLTSVQGTRLVRLSEKGGGGRMCGFAHPVRELLTTSHGGAPNWLDIHGCLSRSRDQFGFVGAECGLVALGYSTIPPPERSYLFYLRKKVRLNRGGDSTSTPINGRVIPNPSWSPYYCTYCIMSPPFSFPVSRFSFPSGCWKSHPARMH